MDVSVVIATHDQKERLVLVLEGLARQALPQERFEVIVVDDGSTDGTREMLEAHSLANLRRLALEVNQGRCVARNTGIRNARGEVVVFLDGDALPHEELLKEYWEGFVDTQGQAVLCGSSHCLPDLEYYQDPQTGALVDLPMASCVRQYLELRRDERILTVAQIGQGIDTLPHRVEEGGYPRLVAKARKRQVEELFGVVPEPQVGWIGFVPHNGAVPLDGLRRVDGFDTQIPFCEGWEMAYRLQRAGYGCRPAPRARSYHLYHVHGFDDPEKAKDEDLIRRRAIEHMVAKHGERRFRLLFFWFAGLSGADLYPEASLIADLVELERRWTEMTKAEMTEYEAVLKRHPLLPDGRHGAAEREIGGEAEVSRAMLLR